MKSATFWNGLRLLVIALVSQFALHGAPARTQSPEEELVALDKLLTDAGQALNNKESLESFLYQTSALASRLDVFELRFGVQPQSFPQWRELRAKAVSLLKRADRKHDKDIYFNADSASAGACVLLELTGQGSVALSRLDKIQPGGGCGNWASSVMLAVNQQRAGIYQRAGDYKKAFAMMQQARGEMDIALGVPEADLFFCRYAFLAQKNGEVKEAQDAYQRVVDLWPGSFGDEIARKALIRMGALIEPDLARINRIYIDDPKSQAYDAAIFAIAAHKFPGAFANLQQRLEKAESWERNRIIPALGETGDARAVPVLQAIIDRDSDLDNSFHAIRALSRLGDRSRIVPFLQRQLSKKQPDIFFDSYWLDSALRDIYGDGPAKMKMDETLNTSPQTLAQRWLDWLKYQQTTGKV